MGLRHHRPRRHSEWTGWLAVALILLPAGCESRPQAVHEKSTEAEAPGPEWVRRAPGIDDLEIVNKQSRARLVRFDLALHTLTSFVTERGQPMIAKQVRQEHRALAVINGGYFTNDGRPEGLRIAANQILSPLLPQKPWGVLQVERDRASIVHTSDFVIRESIQAAIQCGPRLVVDGKVVPGLDVVSTASRSAVALDGEGKRLTLIVEETPVTLRALAELTAALGYTSAINLDGGPSTQLSVKTTGLELELPASAAPSPVTDFLEIRPREGE